MNDRGIMHRFPFRTKDFRTSESSTTSCLWYKMSLTRRVSGGRGGGGGECFSGAEETGTWYSLLIPSIAEVENKWSSTSDLPRVIRSRRRRIFSRNLKIYVSPKIILWHLFLDIRFNLICNSCHVGSLNVAISPVKIRNYWNN